jgi:putative SOS response-associated peptidase YedK
MPTPVSFAVLVPRSNFPARYNIATTDQMPIICVHPRDGERELVMAVGSNSILDEAKDESPPINARAETVPIRW